MTLPEPLRQLCDLDRSSPQFKDQLVRFLGRKEWIRSLQNLRNEDLVWLVEYLDCVSL